MTRGGVSRNDEMGKPPTNGGEECLEGQDGGLAMARRRVSRNDEKEGWLATTRWGNLLLAGEESASKDKMGGSQ